MQLRSDIFVLFPYLPRYFGTDLGYVFKVWATNGREDWSTPYRVPTGTPNIRSTPTIVDGIV